MDEAKFRHPIGVAETLAWPFDRGGGDVRSRLDGLPSVLVVILILVADRVARDTLDESAHAMAETLDPPNNRAMQEPESQPLAGTPQPASPDDAARLPFDPTLRSISDLRWVIDALDARRSEILERWLAAVSDQPFHAGRRERAVADDIPRLFDAVVSYLRGGAEPWRDPGAPLDNPEVVNAARSHARARAAQGLLPSDVVVEFRLLRREIWRGLHEHLIDTAPISDVISAELLINDALDGAITMGLSELTQRVEEVREDFLATTIHEVRQPITAIKGTAQYARRILTRDGDGADLERVVDALNQIAAQSDRMTNLLDTLIDASRAMLGQLVLQRERTDLADLLRRAVEQVEPATGRVIQLALPDDGAAVGDWDGPRLQHVITNLLSNAIKYSPPGSAVDVTLTTTDDQVELTVRDEGIGIEPSELDRLFQRYFRSAAVVEQGIDGVGLGLYLSKQIVEAHGGRIWAQSAGIGHGTTMHVALPRQRAASQDN